MTARLILPETHHVTGGPENVHVNACQADTSHPSVRAVIDAARQMFASPRIWWWRVDAEPFDLIDAGIYDGPLPIVTVDPHGNGLLVTEAGRDEFRAVELTEPCDTCPIDQRGWVLVRDLPSGRTRWEHCPDCYRGKRIVQLVQMCSLRHRGHQHGLALGALSVCRSDGTVPVARVTITLLPVKDRPSGPQPGDGPMIYHFGSCWWLWRADGDYESIVLPFKVEPGQWVVKAVEVTGTD